MTPSPSPRRHLALLAPFLVCATLVAVAMETFAEVPENFRRDRLVAWCVVPFDAKKRTPEQRAAMLERLGLERCAYDWRKEHVPTFEAEIEAYAKHGIEYFAFWGGHPDAYRLFEEHGLKPQVWRTVPSPKEGSQEAKVAAAVAALTPLAEECRERGLAVGLYNHGGWGGEPANLIAVCEAFHGAGHEQVGIVYNFHHAHGDREGFGDKFAAMQPYLLCLNLNGMRDPDAADYEKILTIGEGVHEKAMIAEVIRRGYEGPIGVLGHIKSEDVEVVLRRNLDGLDRILAEIDSATPDGSE